MFVSIRVQGQLAQDPLREHLERRLRAAVQPFARHATGVALRATTLPGKRADATTCRVALALGEGGRVVTGIGRGANVYFATDAAIDRAVRAMAKAVRAAGRDLWRSPAGDAPEPPPPAATGST